VSRPGFRALRLLGVLLFLVREAHGVPSEAERQGKALRGVVPAVAELRESHGPAWNAANGKLYVGYDTSLRSYHYATNTLGPIFSVPNVSGITGMGFTPNGADLFVTTDAEKLRRVRWATERLVPGWTFDPTRLGIRDGRVVELIGGRIYVLDGYDGRSDADPLKYAVYVFNVS
jgi:hypothetical protein